jgi:hypothetical protein
VSSSTSRADRGLDEAVGDVARPPRRFPSERRRAGIAAEAQVLVERPSECLSHLGERPVREWQHLEASGQVSVSPCAMSNGAEPSSTAFRRRLARVSSSHRRLTASDQAGIFWISSSTSSAPSELVAASSRAASHCCAIHPAPRKVGSSALA